MHRAALLELDHELIAAATAVAAAASASDRHPLQPWVDPLLETFASAAAAAEEAQRELGLGGQLALVTLTAPGGGGPLPSLAPERRALVVQTAASLLFDDPAPRWARGLAPGPDPCV